jgi:quercetin dioxygenase-like cupin family protein
VMKQALADIPGREVLMLTLDIPPGGGSAPHRHPGHHIFGYVLEGNYRLKVGDGPEKVLTVIVAESGKPTTVPEKP